MPKHSASPSRQHPWPPDFQWNATIGSSVSRQTGADTLKARSALCLRAPINALYSVLDCCSSFCYRNALRSWFSDLFDTTCACSEPITTHRFDSSFVPFHWVFPCSCSHFCSRSRSRSRFWSLTPLRFKRAWGRTCASARHIGLARQGYVLLLQSRARCCARFCSCSNSRTPSHTLAHSPLARFCLSSPAPGRHAMQTHPIHALIQEQDYPAHCLTEPRRSLG